MIKIAVIGAMLSLGMCVTTSPAKSHYDEAPVPKAATQVQHEGAATCQPRDEIMKTLKNVFKESVVGIGLDQEENLVELTVSEQGTWTLLVTKPGGVTCIFRAGTAWYRAKLE